ncbi:MAG TPA: response regulator transcription factor [Gemmatimonadales bacterium]|jgi:DNA-binding NarL/FixJ family response regulator
MIRVFLADDHPPVREGLNRIIRDDPSFQVVGEASDGAGLLTALDSTQDMLLPDISMPGPGFLELMSRIGSGHPQLKVLVVSMHPEAHYAERALKAGARGYVSKRQSVDGLSRAIMRTLAGGTYVSGQSDQEPYARDAAPPQGTRIGDLSTREFEILVLLAQGRGITQLAGERDLSPKTVSTYRLGVLQKLAMETNADLVRFAIENQLIA